ncbi:hypothetical protein QAD02_010116 [Eretmocerus hayati]|uniref:Uncharacterized protein n=1 Tax=Eretmocerus hayati TaxID=131215 RepID=A0ACC2NBF1_9HYME|nr:hypothetical protein QAD02_010116 [Eretmocerus hayati]
MQDDLLGSEALLVRYSKLTDPNHYSFVVIVECTSDVFSSSGEYIPMSDYSHGVLVTRKHVLTVSHGIHPSSNRKIQVTLRSGESIWITEDGIGMTYNEWAQGMRNRILKRDEDVVILTLPKRVDSEKVQPVSILRKNRLNCAKYFETVALGETEHGVILKQLYRELLEGLNIYDCMDNFDSREGLDVAMGKIFCTRNPPEMRIVSTL